MKKHLLILPLLLLPALAVGKTWQVDAAHSTLGFQGSFQGQTFHGVFKRFDADITYDPANIAHARFDVRVALASVDTRSAMRDQALTGSDFFNVARFPTAHFVTQSFEKKANGQLVAHGTLTLNSITRPVVLNVQFTPHGDNATLEVSTTVNRLDFKLGTRDDWSGISKQIQVHGKLQLQ